MAEKNQKITPFQKQQIETVKKVFDFKQSCEANIVFILYKKPEELFNLNLKLEDFSNNIWKVYFQIAKDLVLIENKPSLDDITVGLYLDKHPKLKEKFEEYGGYATILNSSKFIKEETLHGYIGELKKWNTVLRLCKRNFPIGEKLSEYVDMTVEEIYDIWEALLNDTFADVDNRVKSYNALDGLHDLIEELNKGSGVGLPLYNCHLLNKEIGGINPNGNIYGLGASSGVGKSTTAINYIIPSIISNDEKLVMMINEEDEKKVKKELLIWVANNIFKKELRKYVLRDGGFSTETLELLHKCADYLEEKKENGNIIVIPLERYSVKTAIKIIKKYSSMGVRYFVLDTLKESCDSWTDEIYKSMTRDMVELYDVIKPSAKNVALFVTYQLGKASIKQKYLTNNEIGMAKSIVDVMSVNLMMRRPFESEYEDGNESLIYYRLEGKNGKTKIPEKLKRDKKYMITFITKNRFGLTDEFQIVSEYDMSTNIYNDLGVCNVSQNFNFGR